MQLDNRCNQCQHRPRARWSISFCARGDGGSTQSPPPLLARRPWNFPNRSISQTATQARLSHSERAITQPETERAQTVQLLPDTHWKAVLLLLNFAVRHGFLSTVSQRSILKSLNAGDSIYGDESTVTIGFLLSHTQNRREEANNVFAQNDFTTFKCST